MGEYKVGDKLLNTTTKATLTIRKVEENFITMTQEKDGQRLNDLKLSLFTVKAAIFSDLLRRANDGIVK